SGAGARRDDANRVTSLNNTSAEAALAARDPAMPGPTPTTALYLSPNSPNIRVNSVRFPDSCQFDTNDSAFSSIQECANSASTSPAASSAPARRAIRQRDTLHPFSHAAATTN